MVKKTYTLGARLSCDDIEASGAKSTGKLGEKPREGSSEEGREEEVFGSEGGEGRGSEAFSFLLFTGTGSTSSRSSLVELFS